MHPMPRVLPAAAALLTAFTLASEARAVPFAMGCITNNDAGDCTIAEDQITLDVTDAGGGNVAIELSNAAGEDAVIAAVYFDGDVLDAIVSITNDPPGVEFSAGGAPPNLPGGNPIGFDADLLATADAPPPQNGVGPGEALTITLSIAPGSDFDDVLAALASTDLRVGIHVIAFESGGSESLVNVPEPGALALIALAGAALAGRSLRR